MIRNFHCLGKYTKKTDFLNAISYYSTQAVPNQYRKPKFQNIRKQTHRFVDGEPTGFSNVQFLPKYQMILWLPSILYEKTNQVEFRIPLEMTKPEVVEYLTKIYGLEVESVHTSIVRGKKFRSKRYNNKYWKRPDRKKAYVLLKHPVTLCEEEEGNENVFNDQMKEDVRKVISNESTTKNSIRLTWQNRQMLKNKAIGRSRHKWVEEERSRQALIKRGERKIEKLRKNYRKILTESGESTPTALQGEQKEDKLVMDEESQELETLVSADKKQSSDKVEKVEYEVIDTEPETSKKPTDDEFIETVEEVKETQDEKKK